MRRISRLCFIALFCSVAFLLSGCVIRSVSSDYPGPTVRTEEVLRYYHPDTSSQSAMVQSVTKNGPYSVSSIALESVYGNIQVEYYQHSSKSDDLVLVFPMLGGRNELSSHFAEYLVTFGIDAVVIHRENDFKNPEHFDRLEELCRRDAIKSRLVIDYFEKAYGKKDFGSFGISRGAVSAAIAAGVDRRLEYNVFALGGSDIAGLFRDSDERKIRRYVHQASLSRGITEEELYVQFEQQMKTDPKYLAKYIDARKSLMILGVFDGTVPIKYGYQLREQLGGPETIYLPAGHRTSGLFTQYVSLVPPSNVTAMGLFPLDYLESETLDFFRRSFDRDRFDLKLTILRVIQAPLNFVLELFDP